VVWEAKASGMFRARRISLLELCGFGFEEDFFLEYPSNVERWSTKKCKWNDECYVMVVTSVSGGLF
jgi:hypothetical protein